jgi:hypothetical protein
MSVALVRGVGTLNPALSLFKVNFMIHYWSRCLSFLAAILFLLISSSVTSSAIMAQTSSEIMAQTSSEIMAQATGQATAQAVADANIRISQIYARGGEAGATFQTDYVELFNRGQTDVDVSGWSLNISNFAQSPTSNVSRRHGSGGE